MNMANQIKTIEQLRGKALREKFEEVTGKPTRSNNRPYLIKQITQALEQQHTNGRVEQAKTSGKRKHDQRDPRLPEPGTVLEREYEGKTIRCTVLDDGFRYGNKTYRSLSAVAKEATGTVWNGLLFFKLIPYGRRDAAIS